MQSFFSPSGRKLRSKTDLARYLEEEGITELTADDFDFTVRGKHHSVAQPSKRKITEDVGSEIKRKRGRPSKVSKEIRESKSPLKVGTASKKRQLSQSTEKTASRKSVVSQSKERNDSPKKGKTITQRLVIKMAFTTGESHPKSRKRKSKNLKSAKRKVKSDLDKQQGGSGANENNSDMSSKGVVRREKRKEHYMTPKKNPRFREAVEEDKDVKSHGANVFDLFDREGHMVIGMETNLNMDKDDSIVNGAQNGNQFKESDLSHSSAAVSDDSKSLGRLKRRRSSNIDYALLSGKNRRISFERRTSARRSDSEISSVNQTSNRSDQVTGLDSPDYKSDAAELSEQKVLSSNNSAFRTRENVNTDDDDDDDSEKDRSIELLKCPPKDLIKECSPSPSPSLSPTPHQPSSHPAQSDTTSPQSTSPEAEKSASTEQSEIQVEADDNALDIGKVGVIAHKT